MVFAEHSEHGSSAAPIARHMIDTYFAKKEGKPLPVYPVAGGARAAEARAAPGDDRRRQPLTACSRSLQPVA